MMQIVIEIPEESYRLLQNKGVDWLGAEHILTAVANGIPLPKGHGRLIDADAINIHDISPIYEMEVYGVTQDDIEYEPTIIPAERSDTE
jgi:hypothetical protein